MTLKKRKDNTYFDRDGKQILVGDLLKVFHFKSGNKNFYMYHIVVMEETENFSVMAIKAYHSNIPHCRLHILVNEEMVFETAKIVSEMDFETKRKKIKINGRCG